VTRDDRHEAIDRDDDVLRQIDAVVEVFKLDVMMGEVTKEDCRARAERILALVNEHQAKAFAKYGVSNHQELIAKLDAEIARLEEEAEGDKEAPHE
jgi:hypothetical protein